MKTNLIISFIILVANSAYSQTRVIAFEQELFNEFPNVRDIAISPNGNEIYFSALSVRQDFSAIMEIHKTEKGWSNPSVVSFSGKYRDLEPFISFDGLELYFASNRPVDGREDEKSNFDIWKVKRESIQSGWSEPINLGEPINSELNEYYPAVAKSGNLYFTAEREGTKGKEDIFISEYKDNHYHEPKSLPETVNTTGYEFNAFVDYDEQYIIYTGFGREDGFGGGDLYVSKKDGQGQWLPSYHLDENINSTGLDFCPFVYNKKLYLSSNRSKIKKNYENELSIEDLLKEFNQEQNGKLRLYYSIGLDWLQY